MVPETPLESTLAIGAREHQTDAGRGGDSLDEATEAYAHLPRRKPAWYREDWLPDR